MTTPRAIAGSALATATLNVVVALALIVFQTPEAAHTRPHDGSAPLFQLSPIPAGADWGRR
jgi:hypothetical protein